MVSCSIEYNLSYVYHAMASYFNRDNVGLPGLTQYFRGESLDERGHAQMLMDFQVRIQNLQVLQQFATGSSEQREEHKEGRPKHNVVIANFGVFDAFILDNL